jgi:hypothetical protein
MSTYTVEISLGPDGAAPTHSWTINSGDVPNPADTTQVLDDLNLTWSIPEDQPFPAQPDPQSARVALLLDDANELADIGVGDVGNVRVTSAGTLLWQFSGRIAQPTATIVRRVDAAGNTVRKVRMEIPLVDFIVDLADLKISGDWPAETYAARAAHIEAAFIAAGGPSVFPNPGASTIQLDAQTVTNESALDFLVGFMNQIYVGAQDRNIVSIDVTDDTGAYTVNPETTLVAPGQQPYAPGVLTLAAHLLGVTFDGATPAPAGLTVDSGRVEESSITFTALKFDAIRRVIVTGATVGTVIAERAGIKGRDLAQSTIVADPAMVAASAELYLPEPDTVRWTLDQFTWRPTDADLAGLDYPLNVPSQITSDTQRRILLAQVAIANVDPAIIPGSDSPFYGGSLSQLTLRIFRGNVLVTGRLARRLRTAPLRTVTWADVQVNFPTVHWSSGTDTADPTLSWYEARLARKM